MGAEDSPETPPVTRRGLRSQGSAPQVSDPCTPTQPRRRRTLQAPEIAEKEPDPKRQRSAAPAALPAEKRQKAAVAEAELTTEEVELLDAHGVPSSARGRLAALLRRWGLERGPQVLGLWAFLGDGDERPARTQCLQAWGPAGSGKTAVVHGFLGTMGIQHVWTNCGSLASLGELQAGVVSELARLAGREEDEKTVSLACAQLRGVDRLEAGLRGPLERLAQRVVLVFDNAQELSRLGVGAVELLTRLPEVLQNGDQLTILTISRLPLGRQGLPGERDPDGVAFARYSPKETEAILLREFRGRVASGGSIDLEASEGNNVDLQTMVGTGLMKFAAPQVGSDLRVLLSIGEDLLRSPPEASEGAAGLAALQRAVDRSVRQQTKIYDPTGLVLGEGVGAASAATLRALTNAEKRMLVASFIAAYAEKENDSHLFLSDCRKKQRRGTVKRKKADDDGRPFYAHAPRAVPFARFLAICHRLARLAGSREAQPLSCTLFEHLAALRDARLVRLSGERAAGADTRDPKVMCCAELPLVKACARELKIDLAEYLL